MKVLTLPTSGSLDDLKGKDSMLFTSVISTVLGSKKIIAVCGAGMSCSSGIPDFRSENGLYSLVSKMKSIDEETDQTTTTTSNPFTTGKSLFTSTTAFANSTSTSYYLRFTSALILSSRKAEPTQAHRLLKRLDDRGKMLRVLTQNVDGLESRAGLSVNKTWVDEELFQSSVASSSRLPQMPNTPKLSSRRKSCGPGAAAGPRTMELHGSVHYARCNLCSEEYPTQRGWVERWSFGESVHCEACQIRAFEREFRSARAIKTGMLLPSLVLYDQPHPQGEEIMLQHDKDLARRPDCLIILGTTMKVIGIKKMVKEYIKTVKEEHARQQAKEDERKRAPQFGAHRRVPVIFVNKTRPDKEWENLVDVWVEGECDMFADGVERSWKKERPADWQIQGTLVDDAFGFGTKKRMVGEGRKGDTPNGPKSARARPVLGARALADSADNVPLTPQVSARKRKSEAIAKKDTSASSPEIDSPSVYVKRDRNLVLKRKYDLKEEEDMSMHVTDMWLTPVKAPRQESVLGDYASRGCSSDEESGTPSKRTKRECYMNIFSPPKMRPSGLRGSGASYLRHEDDVVLGSSDSDSDLTDLDELE